jgi:hypothetical protein
MQEEAKRGWWDSNLIKEFEALLGCRPPHVEAIDVAHAF